MSSADLPAPVEPPVVSPKEILLGLARATLSKILQKTPERVDSIAVAALLTMARELEAVDTLGVLPKDYHKIRTFMRARRTPIATNMHSEAKSIVEYHYGRKYFKDPIVMDFFWNLKYLLYLRKVEESWFRRYDINMFSSPYFQFEFIADSTVKEVDIKRDALVLNDHSGFITQDITYASAFDRLNVLSHGGKIRLMNGFSGSTWAVKMVILSCSETQNQLQALLGAAELISVYELHEAIHWMQRTQPHMCHRFQELTLRTEAVVLCNQNAFFWSRFVPRGSLKNAITKLSALWNMRLYSIRVQAQIALTVYLACCNITAAPVVTTLNKIGMTHRAITQENFYLDKDVPKLGGFEATGKYNNQMDSLISEQVGANVSGYSTDSFSVINEIVVTYSDALAADALQELELLSQEVTENGLNLPIEDLLKKDLIVWRLSLLDWMKADEAAQFIRDGKINWFKIYQLFVAALDRCDADFATIMGKRVQEVDFHSVCARVVDAEEQLRNANQKIVELEKKIQELQGKKN